MSGEEFAAIEALAALAREDTFRPGWPFGGTGEWTETLVGLLGGPVGDFVGAASPDVVDGLIAAVRERDNTIARVREAIVTIEMAASAISQFAPGSMSAFAVDVIRAALDPQETQ